MSQQVLGLYSIGCHDDWWTMNLKKKLHGLSPRANPGLGICSQELWPLDHRGGRWIENICKNQSCSNPGIVPKFAWRDWATPRKTSVRTTILLAGNRTENPPNTSPGSHGYSDPIDNCVHKFTTCLIAFKREIISKICKVKFLQKNISKF
jgi:hypothetical protein